MYVMIGLTYFRNGHASSWNDRVLSPCASS